MATATPKNHEAYIRQSSKQALGIAVIIMVGLVLYLVSQRPKNNQQANHYSPPPTVLTPASFQDFIGPVTEVRPDGLTVQMTIVKGVNDSEQRPYAVTVNDKTSYGLYTFDAAGSKVTPLAFSDIKVGDSVGVYSQENLYQLSAFTATRVIKIISP